MATICLYGAASDRISDDYRDDVFALGAEMGKRGHKMIYGAGATGLMGAAARGMDSVGGHVIGVTPHFMHELEPVYDCTELINTETMAERKNIMEKYGEAFVIVPGGIGTFDEFFQVLTLKELGRLGKKPIVLFNVDGYYNPWLMPSVMVSSAALFVLAPWSCSMCATLQLQFLISSKKNLQCNTKPHRISGGVLLFTLLFLHFCDVHQVMIHLLAYTLFCVFTPLHTAQIVVICDKSAFLAWHLGIN